MPYYVSSNKLIKNSFTKKVQKVLSSHPCFKDVLLHILLLGSFGQPAVVVPQP